MRKLIGKRKASPRSRSFRVSALPVSGPGRFCGPVDGYVPLAPSGVRAFPGRKVVTLQIDNIAGGGGGILCLTQLAPSVEGRLMIMVDGGANTIKVQHGFLGHKINPKAETIIIGTFNPGSLCNIEFFYASPRNRLWRLLPHAFGEADLRKASRDVKLEFSGRRQIDFIDIISEVEVEAKEVCNRNDDYLDARVTQWRDVIAELTDLRSVRRLCFTRKTFGKHVREIEKRVLQLKEHFGSKFRLMSSPTRIPNSREQSIWTEFLSGQVASTGTGQSLK
jgi:G:T/U-mismatch repair DNA glycosylase